jgi:hypothetical protein
MEWCRAYREDHVQGLVDKRVGGNRANLSQLQIEELQQVLHQYTPKDRFGSKASTVNGHYWSVEDLAQIVRENMVLNIRVVLHIPICWVSVVLATRRQKRSSSLAVRQRWLILKNSSKKTDRRGSRCTEHCFLD